MGEANTKESLERMAHVYRRQAEKARTAFLNASAERDRYKEALGGLTWASGNALFRLHKNMAVNVGQLEKARDDALKAYEPQA